MRIYEHAPVGPVTSAGAGLELAVPYGRVRAGQVVLGTGAFGPLLRPIANFVVPVLDYVLMTEPRSQAQLDSPGWRDRRGASDMGNQFHYFRPVTFAKLATHFFDTFPQLEGVSCTHAWGGVIDTRSRFCAFLGTAHRGRLAHAAGYTGLGVGATRSGAQVMLRVRLDLTRVCGALRVLLALRGRNAASRRDGTQGATRKPSSGASRVSRGSRAFGMLAVRELPKVGKVQQNRVDKWLGSE